MRTAKTLIRLGGCPGWSASSLGAHSFCWFCHVTAHFTQRVSIYPHVYSPKHELSIVYRDSVSVRSWSFERNNPPAYRCETEWLRDNDAFLCRRLNNDGHLDRFTRWLVASVCLWSGSPWFTSRSPYLWLSVLIFASSNLGRRMTKPRKWPLRPAKTQISLGICPVWSESSLCSNVKIHTRICLSYFTPTIAGPIRHSLKDALPLQGIRLKTFERQNKWSANWSFGNITAPKVWKQQTRFDWACSWEIMADTTSLTTPSPGLSAALFPNKSSGRF